MKFRRLVAAMLLAGAMSLAHASVTVTTTAGKWDLYKGSSKVASYNTESECVAGAKDKAATQPVGVYSYFCKTSTKVTATVVADPPPPPPPAPAPAPVPPPPPPPPAPAPAPAPVPAPPPPAPAPAPVPAPPPAPAPAPAPAPSPAPPPPGGALLSWSAPTTKADSANLDNLAGFRIRYGTASGVYTASIDVTDPSATQVAITGLAAGTWFFRVYAFDTNGNEDQGGGYEVSKTIE